jgi:hypothetical protein
VIDFSPEYPNSKLLKKAVNWAKKNKDHIPSLSALAKQDVDTLTQLGKDWQKLGLGTLMECTHAEGHRSVLFCLNEKAVTVVDQMHERSVLGWLCSINRSDWISFSSLIVAIASAIVSILAYLNSSE